MNNGACLKYISDGDFCDPAVAHLLDILTQLGKTVPEAKQMIMEKYTIFPGNIPADDANYIAGRVKTRIDTGELRLVMPDTEERANRIDRALLKEMSAHYGINLLPDCNPAIDYSVVMGILPMERVLGAAHGSVQAHVDRLWREKNGKKACGQKGR